MFTKLRILGLEEFQTTGNTTYDQCDTQKKCMYLLTQKKKKSIFD